jgi:hypothetical protein
MEKNVGDIDKTIRIVIGLALLSMIFLLPGNARWLGLIGILPILTAVTHWCPAYTVFGISTCKTK